MFVLVRRCGWMVSEPSQHEEIRDELVLCLDGEVAACRSRKDMQCDADYINDRSNFPVRLAHNQTFESDARVRWMPNERSRWPKKWQAQFPKIVAAKIY